MRSNVTILDREYIHMIVNTQWNSLINDTLTAAV